ncbi:hypothetical protein TRFO_19571 [Tritrichomonas foetus]|uniref:Leucine Rich Repeat family protein n=1 Tax=Tritrichomonas foetus TaxID=1144522 RepID=A0A1J4KHW4_9EUKA|nr:hypothetical protein TRFO_19571 [Tritrichomonas foetus]|eukprot:OHT10983.1 hypothetical protein TRFO_19571 [Tritrichomonas foetus]
MSVVSRNASVSRFSRRPSTATKTLSSTRRSQSVVSMRPGEKKTGHKPMASISDNIIHTRQKLASFSDLSLPPTTKTLTVEYNEIKDFRGLPPLSQLDKIDIGHNPLESLYGFPVLPAIKAININHTPFGNTEFARISLIMLCGNTLRTINGESIKPSEIRVSREYPADCVNLLRSGWIMTYPPPNPKEMISLKRKLSKKMVAPKPKREAAAPRIMHRTPNKQSSVYNTKLALQDQEIARLSREIEKLQARHF